MKPVVCREGCTRAQNILYVAVLLNMKQEIEHVWQRECCSTHNLKLNPRRGFMLRKSVRCVRRCISQTVDRKGYAPMVQNVQQDGETCFFNLPDPAETFFDLPDPAETFFDLPDPAETFFDLPDPAETFFD